MAIPISVNVTGVVFIISVPFAPTIAINQTSPLLIPPSQVASGTNEFVAPALVALIGEQEVPTVRNVAEHGSSP